MTGSRYPIFLFLLFQMLVAGAFAYQQFDSGKQQIFTDQANVISELRLLDTWDPSLATEVLERFHVQFARSAVEGTNEAWTFGRFKASQHPLSSLIDPSLMQTQFKYFDRNLTIGMNVDFYFERHQQTVLVLVGILSAINVLFCLLIVARGRRHSENIKILEMSILRLPSFELPSAVFKVGGPLAPLTASLKESLDVLKKQFNGIQKAKADQAHEAMTDPVTKLANRAAFNLDMEQVNSNNASRGQLLLLRADGLEEINERRGKQNGDRYLETMATRLSQFAGSDSKLTLYRYSSSDFLIRWPNISTKDLNALLSPLSLQLTELAAEEEIPCAGHIGVVPYQSEDRISQLLIHLDTAISIAQSQGPNSFYCLEAPMMELELENDHWDEVIEDVLSNESVELISQPIVSFNEDKAIYHELFARFSNKDGNPLPTTTLIAMASRANRVVELDKLIFAQVVREILHHSDQERCYGLNLANHSLTNIEFLNWIEQRISRTPALSGRLVLEISERSIDINPHQLNKWIQRIHHHGIRISIERFGNGLSSFRSLQLLKPDFVKLDPSFTKDIDDNSNNRFFIKMLLDIAVRLEIRVIATHIERYEERITLEALRVDGIQGQLIASPKPLTHQPANS